ncbi:hypothetical protein GCM10022408_14420 [Hymenobacter fastidiosus]|uniref:LamG-like jellyroll fold domain-containing protein n=1 Tax=Hymenobacter fastidiosus TaxID=486264 RepID=A0ABP7RYM1_9BACT
MKKQKFYLLILSWLCFGAMAAFSSCSESDDDNTTPQVNSNKTTLTAVIDSVTTIYTGAVEGVKPGTYAVGSRATLKTAIDLGTATKNDATATQAAVNTAVSSLRRAAVTFNASRLQEVSVANLMAYWKFSGNANDATANGNNGTGKVGKIGATTPVDGTLVPVLVADRFGRANEAYQFGGGAYIEVPYKAVLNPQTMTISLWCKRSDTNADNYLVSLNRWNGFKFQLQSANKPFLTATTTTGIFDRDADSGIVPLNKWTHVATSYVDGALKFYIDGELVKTWTDTKGAIKAIPQNIPLCIGQQLPSTIYNSTPTAAGLPADYYQFYSEAFFKGQMDDIRIYNKALSDAEVKSIFTFENTL